MHFLPDLYPSSILTTGFNVLSLSLSFPLSRSGFINRPSNYIKFLIVLMHFTQ